MSSKRTILVTGGAGFIGSALVRHVLATSQDRVINLDKLTYAGNLESLVSVASHPRYAFEKVDICNRRELERVFQTHQPDIVMHLAAESHVDRSIDDAAQFIQTNVMGTYTLLEVATGYWRGGGAARRRDFRFHHVSTDEVYGDLGVDGEPANESTPYAPSSPYAASKASADHLVRAWQRTYGLPAVITNCTNNYGPYQFPEKLIPLMILNALEGKPLPVYGRGDQTRDWLFVDDHARALHLVAKCAPTGSSYNIGGRNQCRNIDVVHALCALLDEVAPRKAGGVHHELITHVTDRPGHDLRYALDSSRIERDLGWRPQETFESGLRRTVTWYLENRPWCRRVQDGSYQRERLGLAVG